MATYSATGFAANNVCSEVATLEQATELMTRLFPDSKIINAEPLKVAASKSCLLEVEMLTAQNNPRTQGVVYVLPDGDHFLNGPLMSKRSKVEQSPEVEPTSGQTMPELTSSETTAPSPFEPSIVEAVTAAAALATNTNASAAKPEPTKSESLREKTLRELQAHPFISFNYTDQPKGVANVLLMCHAHSVLANTKKWKRLLKNMT